VFDNLVIIHLVNVTLGRDISSEVFLERFHT